MNHYHCLLIKIHIIVFTNLFTKYAKIFAIAKMDAKIIVEVHIEKIICKYRAPTKLLSNRGRNFIGNVFTRICEYLGVSKLKIFSFYPPNQWFHEVF
jgi:hypothetical protein